MTPEEKRSKTNKRAREYRARNAVRLRAYWNKCRLENRDTINSRNRQRRKNNTEAAREYERQGYAKNQGVVRDRKRKEYHKNRSLRVKQMRAWRQRSMEHRRKYRREYNLKYRNTDKYRFENALRQRIWNVVRRRTKGTSKKCASTALLIGCPIADLKIYLESKFETGMTWQNFGKVWHVDHIMPCAIFDLSKNSHQKRCFHFSNLRPCFAQENIRKGKKVLSDQFALI